MIHRDIKPDNILLHDGRALVADFGIALAVSNVGADRITETGLSLGTPEYMSPEQISGARDIDGRSDVYSLGAVLYEMLTGEPPHTGTTSQAVAAKILTEPPTPPRTTRPGVPAELEAAVLRALAKQPVDRFASGQAFADALEGSGVSRLKPEVSGTRPTLMRSPLRRARLWMAGLGTVAGASLTTAVVLLWPHLGDRGVTLHPNRVVVAPFENRTGDSSLNTFGGLAAEWISQGLHLTQALEAVPSHYVAPVVAYLDRRTAEGLPADPIETLSRETGAGLVIVGNYYLVGDSLQVQAQIIDAVTGELLGAPPPVLAPRNAPQQALEQLRSHVMGGLSSRIQANWRDLVYSGTDAPNWEAFQVADAGVKAFQRNRLAEAIPLLERAAALDSGHLGSWALALAANAERNLGTGSGDGDTSRLAKADSMLGVLEARRAKLPAHQVHFNDGVAGLVRGDYLGSLRAMRDVARAYPRSLAPFGTGYDAWHARRPREALYWFKAVDPNAAAVENWRPYWSFYWITYHFLGDYERELEVKRHYRERFPNVSRSRMEIPPRAAAGDRDAVLGLLDQTAGQGRQQFLNQALVAWRELRAHGYPDHASSVLDWALEHYPAREEDGRSDRLYQSILEAQGNWAEARRVAEEMGPRPRFIDSLNFRGEIGVLDARTGNRERALGADRGFQTMTTPYMLGRHTIWRARIWAALGERDKAVALVAQALDEGYLGLAWLHVDPAFESVRHDPAFQDALRPRDDDWQPPDARHPWLLLAALGIAVLCVGLALYVGRFRTRVAVGDS